MFPGPHDWRTRCCQRRGRRLLGRLSQGPAGSQIEVSVAPRPAFSQLFLFWPGQTTPTHGPRTLQNSQYATSLLHVSKDSQWHVFSFSSELEAKESEAANASRQRVKADCQDLLALGSGSLASPGQHRTHSERQGQLGGNPPSSNMITNFQVGDTKRSAISS